MNLRTKNQSDLMFNLRLEFAIHGDHCKDDLIATINEFLSHRGDEIRLVGFNCVKPTARVDLYPLVQSVDVMPTEDEMRNMQKLAANADLAQTIHFIKTLQQWEAIMRTSQEEKDINKAEEDVNHDTESD